MPRKKKAPAIEEKRYGPGGFMGRPPDIDFGDGVQLWWTTWSPDRKLNPQYADLPDVTRLGAIIAHGECYSGIHFKSETAARIFPEHHMWDVLSWDPLTLQPSLLCKAPGCTWHVFIRDGRVVPC